MNGVMCVIRFKNSDSLAHYGVKGQKKGERRYQYEDGTLTPEGREHYGVGDGDERLRKYQDENGNINKEYAKNDLKAKYWRKMGQNLGMNVGGRLLRNAGAVMQLGVSNPSIQAAGRLISTVGTLGVWGSRFRAVANTGSYFINKNMIEDYEPSKRKA